MALGCSLFVYPFFCISASFTDNFNYLHSYTEKTILRVPMPVSHYFKSKKHKRCQERSIDGLQSRDETAMLVDKTIANYGSYFA